MAKLFLSYSRKDEAKARGLTAWLEREGHEVWRDEDDIGGGASFSSEIENALKDCSAVLVLWSAESVKSAWVRDEAGYGRDAGKLIPFSLDETEPPLGFRQYQAIGLARWKGHGQPPNADRIRNSITRVSGHCEAASAKQSAPTAGARKLRVRSPLLIGGVIALAVALLSVVLWQRRSGDQQITIAVMPSPQSSDRTMAADYANVAAADMAAFLPRRFDRAAVIAPADAGRVASGYRMEISTNPHGVGADATVTLSDEEGHATLWSQNWSVADAAAADLKGKVSASASKAALCLTDARGGGKPLSQPALGLYLSGCEGFSNTDVSDTDFVTLFQRVTKLAPDFAPGWGYLALSEATFADGERNTSPAAFEKMAKSARQAIAMVRKMDPNSAFPYHAEYHLITSEDYRAFPLLERAAELDPNDGLVQMHISDELMSVGRAAESVEAAKRGVQLEPAAAYARSQYILALIYAGEFSKAKADIAEARKKWPKDPVIDDTDFTLEFRYGDPHAALALLPRITDSDAKMAIYRKLIQARLDPTAAKIDEAIAVLQAQTSNNPSARMNLLSAFGNFGRVDQAYQLLEDPTFQPFVRRTVLFRPSFVAIRADPRFMQVAARLGLVRYWRQTGSWPDFCTTEKLGYDCKTEAAKYPN